MFVLPALLVFVLPVLALVFFKHVEMTVDKEARQRMRAAIVEDKSLTDAQRKEAFDWIDAHPASELVQDAEWSKGLDWQTRLEYSSRRWMVRLSIASIVAGLAIFAAGGACARLSYRSQFTQYLTLAIGWPVLRIYATLQTIVIGVLMIALSYWVTAAWMNIYSPQLIFIVSALALIGVCSTIFVIFRRPRNVHSIGGKVLDRSLSPGLWRALDSIAQRVSTTAPDRVIVGIDSGFFVTEMPVSVGGNLYDGRSLFVSLPLLKQMDGIEASAVLAHEMAHFSGEDTIYAKRISPLLSRYDMYLDALAGSLPGLPVFYFMQCFRALFELSLGHLRRQRELRADQLASQLFSGEAVSRGLLRHVAYSVYRRQIENELFQSEQVITEAEVGRAVERGFPAFEAWFVATVDLADIEVPHPFDTHPTLSQRLTAVGVNPASPRIRELLKEGGDGAWYQLVDDAEGIEREMWSSFDEQFRRNHRLNLAHRYLPETEEERGVVEEWFPPIIVEGKDGPVTFDFRSMHSAGWEERVDFSDIKKCYSDDKGVLWVECVCGGKQRKERIRLKKYPGRGQAIIDTFQRYSSRYQMAIQHQTAKRFQLARESQSAATTETPGS
ncbi:MAG: M48 family metallopeptidase [Phycisphaerales bacterium]